ncbi:hypothetical protein NEOLEDRAFT_647974 [Neolentinus lepideus HHB14362 ss-1]|uniref:Uncharacterized protein n=1 Tax=Neolentinus lepideus HHB14362 ss-1 TaxID=1314782 RepID=A0A165QI14_9AGAM|nr:hypothetical protein NEOLEDRAFT_647974 [Neolentinus lepideus HHB14362 ss-1]
MVDRSKRSASQARLLMTADLPRQTSRSCVLKTMFVPRLRPNTSRVIFSASFHQTSDEGILPCLSYVSLTAYVWGKGTISRLSAYDSRIKSVVDLREELMLDENSMS